MLVVRMSATTARVTHLWSAGTICHGAQSVLVAVMASSYASWYSSQCARSATSPTENFQFLSGSSSRSRNRCFCSCFERCRKNFSTIVPLRTR